MKNFTKISFATGVALAALSVAVPAQAAVLFDNGTFKLEDVNVGGQPVNLNSISADQKTVIGDYNGGTVTFTSTTDLAFNQGAATIYAAAKKGVLTDLSINIGAPGYNVAGFAFAGDGIFNLVVNGTTTISNITIPSGNTAFKLSGAGIQTLAFTFDPGIDTEKQFRLQGLSTSAVPEPTTWAMLIAGLGVVGASMRRRKTAVSFA
ncbi:MAG: PEP-CTERM sorting domain-containing protein [Sphingobium sp.]|nr:PEP-CTERM sorting domain-containing protein [Sphingobium sp.]